MTHFDLVENGKGSLWRDLIEAELEDLKLKECYLLSDEEFRFLKERADAAAEDSKKIERIVRDAIIGYVDMFPSVPNEEAEAELKQRAETANAWLVSHGFKPEEVTWSKEEVNPF